MYTTQRAEQGLKQILIHSVSTSMIYNSQKVEVIQTFISGWMGKQMVYAYKECIYIQSKKIKGMKFWFSYYTGEPW